MEMKTVKSSSVLEVGYDQYARTLRVRFKNGSVYDYQNVEAAVADELRAAESVGKALRERIIRQADQYPYRRVREDGKDA